jgi:hypothetical protein
MRQLIKGVGALAIAYTLGTQLGPAAAHHSMVMYDRTRTVTLTSTVVELQWNNPHVFLLVNGRTGEGDPSGVWHLETSGPTNLARLPGWSPTALKPGDRVTARSIRCAKASSATRA